MQVMREIVLPDNEAIKKLESFLKKEFAIGYVRKLFRKNGVRINGRRAKADDLIRGGDRIQLYIGFARQADSVQPFKAVAKLDIVYEDEALLVINKPAGIAVHEGKSVSKRDSVLGILETTYRHRGIKPQLVHRIDRDTSGLLLIAKNRHIAAELESCFETGAVEKNISVLSSAGCRIMKGRSTSPYPVARATRCAPAAPSRCRPSS